MKAHHYVVESSPEPYDVFAGFFGPSREGFRIKHYVTCLSQHGGSSERMRDIAET